MSSGRGSKLDDAPSSNRSSGFFSVLKSPNARPGSVSLTDSLRAASPYQTSPSDDYFKLPLSDLNVKSGRISPPKHVDIPELPLGAELALVALQYLPTPLLVLADSKVIITANDAMGLLLGLNKYEIDDSKIAEQEEQDVVVGDLLEGQTLSRIGIDMVQDGQSIWVDWEVSFIGGY